MVVILIRHGATRDSELKRYSGRRDLNLTSSGVQGIKAKRDSILATINAYRSPEGKDSNAVCRGNSLTVYTSSKRRAIQTANIVFSHTSYKVDIRPIKGFNEMDFGLFEGHNAKELSDTTHFPTLAPLYRAWVEGGCMGQCPNGEDKESFCHRVIDAFSDIVSDTISKGATSPVVIVSHWGTIMALREYIEGTPYFSTRIGANLALGDHIVLSFSPSDKSRSVSLPKGEPRSVSLPKGEPLK